MTRGLKKTVIIGLAAVIALMTVGCQSDAGTGALIGTGIGAGVGAIAGRSTEATLIGGAVGGGAGYLIGNERDKKKERERTDSQIQPLRNEANTVTVNITNSNGSISPITLQRQGTGYVGSRGEFYPSLPTEAQLKTVYGF